MYIPRVDEHVEVDIHEEGFQGSKWEAMVNSVNGVEKTALIEYAELIDDTTGGKLKEEQSFENIWPVPENDSDKPLSERLVGDAVDCWSDDGWWKGVVYIACNDGLLIYFPLTTDSLDMQSVTPQTVADNQRKVRTGVDWDPKLQEWVNRPVQMYEGCRDYRRKVVIKKTASADGGWTDDDDGEHAACQDFSVSDFLEKRVPFPYELERECKVTSGKDGNVKSQNGVDDDNNNGCELKLALISNQRDGDSLGSLPANAAHIGQEGQKSVQKSTRTSEEAFFEDDLSSKSKVTSPKRGEVQAEGRKSPSMRKGRRPESGKSKGSPSPGRKSKSPRGRKKSNEPTSPLSKKTDVSVSGSARGLRTRSSSPVRTPGKRSREVQKVDVAAILSQRSGPPHKRQKNTNEMIHKSQVGKAASCDHVDPSSASQLELTQDLLGPDTEMDTPQGKSLQQFSAMEYPRPQLAGPCHWKQVLYHRTKVQGRFAGYCIGPKVCVDGLGWVYDEEVISRSLKVKLPGVSRVDFASGMLFGSRKRYSSGYLCITFNSIDHAVRGMAELDSYYLCIPGCPVLRPLIAHFPMWLDNPWGMDDVPGRVALESGIVPPHFCQMNTVPFDSALEWRHLSRVQTATKKALCKSYIRDISQVINQYKGALLVPDKSVYKRAYRVGLKQTLWLKAVPKTLSESYIRSVFEQFDECCQVHCMVDPVTGDGAGHVLIDFEDETKAGDVCQDMNSYLYLAGGTPRPLDVQIFDGGAPTGFEAVLDSAIKDTLEVEMTDFSQDMFGHVRIRKIDSNSPNDSVRNQCSLAIRRIMEKMAHDRASLFLRNREDRLQLHHTHSKYFANELHQFRILSEALGASKCQS